MDQDYQAELDELVSEWDKKNRSVSSIAFLYDLGLVLFSWQESAAAGEKVRGPYAALFVRNVVLSLAGTAGRRVGPALAASVPAYAVAVAALGRGADPGRLVADRALSQMGVSATWALAVDSPGLRMRNLAFIPLLAQAANTRLWRSGRREGAVYVAREGLWGVMTLYAVQGLRADLTAAVAHARDAARARRDASLARQEAAKEHIAFLHGHHGPRATLRGLESARYLSGADAARGHEGARRLEQLLLAEEERLRAMADSAPHGAHMTVRSAVWRAICARRADAGPSVWTAELEEPLFVHDDDRRILDDVIAIAARAEGPLYVDTVASAGALLFRVRADRLRARDGASVKPRKDGRGWSAEARVRLVEA